MHFFTLLIAAAFSTQFVAPNPTADVFTLDIDTIVFKEKTEAFTFKATAKTATTWPTASPVYYIVSQDPALDATKAATEAIKDTISAGHTDDEIDVTVNAANMTTLTGAGLTAFTFYVYAGLSDAAGAIANAPVPVTLIADFTPDRKAIRKAKVTAQAACKITLTEEGTGSWGVTPAVVVTKDPTGAGGVTLTLAGQTSGTAEFTITKANWATIAVTTETDLYIFAGATAVAAKAAPSYKMPLVADEFGLAPTELAATATAIKDIVISPVATITPDANKISIHLSKTEVFDLTEVGLAWKEAAKVTTTNTYKLASFDVSELTSIAIGDVIHVYVKYAVTTPSAETIYMRHSQEILVKPLFVVEPANIYSDVLTIPTVTITTSSVDWTNPIEVKFSKTATSPPVAGDVFKTATPAPTGKVYEVTGITLPEDAPWKAAPTIFVHVGVKDGSNYVYTGIAPVPITVTAVKFSLATDALKESDTAITNIVVTPTPDIVVQGTNEVTLYFSTDPTELPSAIPTTRQAKAAFATDKYTLASWTVHSTLVLNKDTPVIVHVSYLLGSSSTVTFLEPARTITVAPGVWELEFAVAPKTLWSDVTTIKGLTITPTDVTGWDNTIKFKITDVDPEAGGQSNAEKTGTATKSGAVWTATADVDISGLTHTEGTTLYVYASKANTDEFLRVTDTITVGGPTPPEAAFTVDPTEVELKDLAAFKTIKITENTESNAWTAIWVVISTTTGQQAPGANDVVKEDQAVTAGVCTITLDAADFTKLGTLDLTKTLYVHAAPVSSAAALAATPATITFKKTQSFAIAPKEMEWKETLTTAEITITAAYPELLPTTEADTFVAKFTKGTGETAKVVPKKIAISGTGTSMAWKIPATDLAELAIAKPTATETIKVSLHTADGEIGTAVDFKINKPGGGSAAMGVSPLLSLLAAALLLLVKLF